MPMSSPVLRTPLGAPSTSEAIRRRSGVPKVPVSGPWGPELENPMAQRGRHGRDSYLINDTMLVASSDGTPVTTKASTLALSTEFRFSRFAGDGVKGQPHDVDLLAQIAAKMTSTANRPKAGDIPAGYTYLGQFLDHDLTLDPTQLDIGRTRITDLQSLRSPTLDLDSLYGGGPQADPQFYEADGLHLKTDAPLPVPGVPALAAQKGFDLPRRHVDSVDGPARQALIPDRRNDENLAVAQVHLAFIRFHNRVVDDLMDRGSSTAGLFERAQEQVVLHYQHMVRTDFLPRIVQRSVVDDVFANGRRVFETDGDPLNATMPLEFAGAAFRLGHSMVRTGYSWNRFFPALQDGHIFRLFRFSGTSGTLLPTEHPPGSEADLSELEGGPFGSALPSIWVTDWARLFDFSHITDAAGAPITALARPAAEFNMAAFIDAAVVNPLERLPMGSLSAPATASKRNLAFRNLVRGNMMELPSGQQLAAAMTGLGLDIRVLTDAEVLGGLGDGTSPVLAAADIPGLDAIHGRTPLWLYVLREAEFNGGRLTGVGARVVAETFHRAMQASRISLLNRPFQVEFGPGAAANRFDMADLLFHAYGSDPARLDPTGA